MDWIAQAKAIGATVELITNGTLLTEEKARALIASGLDNLWISIDGATPESYADVRLGAHLPLVIENVMRLRRLRKGGHFAKPEIDVAFVAMKRNIHESARHAQIGAASGRAAVQSQQCAAVYGGTARRDLICPGVS